MLILTPVVGSPFSLNRARSLEFAPRISNTMVDKAGSSAISDRRQGEFLDPREIPDRNFQAPRRPSRMTSSRQLLQFRPLPNAI